jgi:1-acyl-sn-glycerol-3-phosphate acyltransferase
MVTLYTPIGLVLVRPFLAALRPVVSGRERIPKKGPAILAANHESVVDPFVLGMATWREIRWVAKAELWKRRLYRPFLAAFGTIPIERGGGDHAAVADARRVLERGGLVGIFPQGTCLPYRRRPFQRGAARLALQTGAPIVPIALVNTEKVLPPGRFRPGFPRPRIIVGDPIAVARGEPTRQSAAEVTEQIERAIVDLRQPYGEPAHAWIE